MLEYFYILVYFENFSYHYSTFYKTGIYLKINNL